MLVLVLPVLLAVVAAAPPVRADDPEDPPVHGFTPVGPRGVNGWVHRVVFDPADPSVAWAGCDDTIGLWRSGAGTKARTTSPPATDSSYRPVAPRLTTRSRYSVDLNNGRCYSTFPRSA